MDIKKMEHKCEEVSGIFKHLAHPQRLMLLCHLSEGEKTVGELQELTQLSQSQTSQFLKRMQLEELLQSRKESNFAYYSIKDKNILKLLRSMQNIFC